MIINVAQAWNAYYQWAAQQQQHPSPQPGMFVLSVLLQAVN